MHSVSEAMAAVKVAASIFERFSFDLIYARPNQTPEAWRAELGEAIGHAAEHLSLYQLTIEPGTWFENLHRAGKLTVPSDEEARILYEVTQEVCEAHGLPAYEISNHARPGEESRHNLVYWRYGEYAGIGPGAHGRLVDRQRAPCDRDRKASRDLARTVERAGNGIVEEEFLTAEAEGDEFLLMGLRLSEGIDPTRYAAFSGHPLDEERIRALEAHGFLVRPTPQRLAVTREGFPVLDAVVADLAA